MNRMNLTKVLSTSLSLALVATSAPLPAGAVGPVAAMPAFVAKLTPPEQFGYVASSFAPKGEAQPRMVLIADLHAHVEVQHNIIGILQHTVGQLRGSGSPMANKTVPVFVEGGWDSHLEEPLQKVDDPVVRPFLAEYFLHKSELNAAQAFSEKVAGTNQVELIGVESKAEYMLNRAQFLKTYPARKALLTAIQREEATMREITGVLTNRTFGNLQDLRDRYNAGRVRPEVFAHALLGLAHRYKVQSKHLRTLENLSVANQTEMDIALAESYRAVIQASASKRPLTALLRRSLENEGGMRENLARIDASLDLLKRLVGNQLTPSEVPLTIARMPELIETANLLLTNSPLKDSASKVIRESFGFYPFAELRDRALAENSINALKSFGPDATGILVTGGFHTDAIANRLRKEQISYIIINPTITRDLSTEEQMNYIKRMGEEHVTAGEIKQDIESLRQNKSVQAQSPAPAMTNLGDPAAPAGPKAKIPGDGDLQNYMGAVNVKAVRAQIDSANKNLTDELAKKSDVVSAAKEAFKAASQELKNAQAQVLGIVAKKQPEKLAAYRTALSSDNNMFVSLKRGADGFETTHGFIGVEGKDLADLVNELETEFKGVAGRGESIDNYHVIVLDNALELIGSPAQIAVDNSNQRTIMIDRKTVENWIAARDPAARKEVQHEILHGILTQGKSETATVLATYAIRLLDVAREAARTAAQGAGETAVRGAIAGELQNLIGEAGLVADPLFKEILSQQWLANTIAEGVSPNVFSGGNAKKILDALMQVSPKTQMQIDREMNDLTGSSYFRNLTGGKDEAGRIRDVVKGMSDLSAKLRGKDYVLSDEDVRRILTALGETEDQDLAAARAIISAA